MRPCRRASCARNSAAVAEAVTARDIQTLLRLLPRETAALIVDEITAIEQNPGYMPGVLLNTDPLDDELRGTFVDGNVPGFLIFFRVTDNGAAVVIEALIRLDYPEQIDLGIPLL